MTFLRVLLTLDRQISSYAGRQCVLQDEECVPFISLIYRFSKAHPLAMTLSFQLTVMTSSGFIQIRP
jgi:hypothetical protein